MRFKNFYFALLILFSFFIIETSANADIKTNYIIIIDPQYGGKDLGPKNSAKGLYAKEFTLNIATQLGKLIKNNTNHKIIYTRNSDKYVSFEKRIDIINKSIGDILISFGMIQYENIDLKGIMLINSIFRLILHIRYNSTRYCNERNSHL